MIRKNWLSKMTSIALLSYSLSNPTMQSFRGNLWLNVHSRFVSKWFLYTSLEKKKVVMSSREMLNRTWQESFVLLSYTLPLCLKSIALFLWWDLLRITLQVSMGNIHSSHFWLQHWKWLRELLQSTHAFWL